MGVRPILSFPDPVKETSARVVAAGVVAMALLFLATGEGLLLVPIVYGFVARVATGPTLSPLGQFATRLGTPFLERRFGVRSRLVPGPPKRFAQAIGLAFSGMAALAWLAGFPAGAYGLLAALVVASTLE
ncbi:MAG: DUF4395 domain-containing protein, partial [Ilumatobacteraceae bacterium]